MGEKRADGTDLETCPRAGDEAAWTPRRVDGVWGNIYCRTTACNDYLDALLLDDKVFYCAPEVVAQDTGAPTDAEELKEYDEGIELAYNDAKLKYTNIKKYCGQESSCESSETQDGESWADAYNDFPTECGELCAPGGKCEKYGNKCRTTACRKSLAFLDVGRSGKCNPQYVNQEKTLKDINAEWDDIRTICTADKDYSDQIQKPVRSTEDNSSPNLHSLVGTLAGLAFSGLCILLA